MEQWHQKLHNNSSPDDVVICQVCGAGVDGLFYGHVERELDDTPLLHNAQPCTRHTQFCAFFIQP